MLERITRYNQGSRYRLDIPKGRTKSKLSPVREDGQDRSLFSRQKDIMSQVALSRTAIPIS